MSPIPSIIETKRLRLRTWHASDLDWFVALNADPEVMRHFPTTLSRLETEAFLERLVKHQEQHGYCYFAAIERTTNQPIGFIGLAVQNYKIETEAGILAAPFTDIGWRLSPNYWGNGYATEGAQACLEFGFCESGLTEIYATATHSNTASLRVMQRLGMRHQSTFQHPKLDEANFLQPCELYRLRKEDRLSVR